MGVHEGGWTLGAALAIALVVFANEVDSFSTSPPGFTPISGEQTTIYVTVCYCVLLC